MALLVLGINHRTASVDVREKVAFAPEELNTAHKHVVLLPDISEAVIVSTCNRSEIYCNLDTEVMRDVSALKSATDAILQWLADFHNVDVESLRSSAYQYLDLEAVTHLARVASGLDSLVLGEPQILGQLKSAYAVAIESETTGQHLNRLFQHSFAVAKEVRTQTAIGENPVSVAYAAVTLSTHIFDDLSQCTALLIGAGETIDLVARHLRDKGIKKVIVANRTLARAEALAKEFNAEAVMLADIPDCLYRADIVISSTASQLPILGKGVVEDALKRRKRRPMFMVDIAVPRDIEEQVGQLADIYLYTVDDLKEVIVENIKSREAAAIEAHDIVLQQTQRYEELLKSLNAVDTIKQFREQIEQIKAAELKKAMKKLAKGDNPEQVLEQLASGLANKYAHRPTSFAKKAVTEGRVQALNWINDIFSLEDRSK